jgi:hypothetical protein
MIDMKGKPMDIGFFMLRRLKKCRHEQNCNLCEVEPSSWRPGGFSPLAH